MRTFNIRTMKLSDGIEWGIHVTTLLAVLPSEAALPAARLAEFHGVPAAYLAKHLQALSRAGILESVHGPGGGIAWRRRPLVLPCSMWWKRSTARSRRSAVPKSAAEVRPRSRQPLISCRAESTAR